jgi:hypothetical protein
MGSRKGLRGPVHKQCECLFASQSQCQWLTKGTGVLLRIPNNIYMKRLQNNICKFWGRFIHAAGVCPMHRRTTSPTALAGQIYTPSPTSLGFCSKMGEMEFVCCTCVDRGTTHGWKVPLNSKAATKSFCTALCNMCGPISIAISRYRDPHPLTETPSWLRLFSWGISNYMCRTRTPFTFCMLGALRCSIETPLLLRRFTQKLPNPVYISIWGVTVCVLFLGCLE